MSRLVDLHAHVLPGVDDGPPNLDEAIALARDMVEGGVGTVVATSHVSTRYPNRPETLGRARERLVAALADQGIDLRVESGAEITLEQAALLDDEVLAKLALAGGPYLLLESPLSPAAMDIEGQVTGILDRGFLVVLAHPERSPAFQRAPMDLERLVADGALSAVTAGAFAGRFGRTARAFARRLAVDGLVHVITSDAHDLSGRPPGLGPDVVDTTDLIGMDELLPWLTSEAPAAILRGEPIGLPPVAVEERPQKTGFLRRLRGGRGSHD
jgi:protein-tyrosine phosphatase